MTVAMAHPCAESRRGSQPEAPPVHRNAKSLWIVPPLFLFGGEACRIIAHHRRGDSTRMDRIRVKRPSDVARSQDEARLALRCVVHATRAHLAEMDCLLARTDWLVLHAMSSPLLATSTSTRKRRHACLAQGALTSRP